MISSRETLSFRISVKGFSFEGCFEDGAKIEFRSDWWCPDDYRRIEKNHSPLRLMLRFTREILKKRFSAKQGTPRTRSFVRINFDHDGFAPTKRTRNKSSLFFLSSSIKEKKKRERKKRTLDPPLDLSAKFRNSPMRLDGARAENKRIGTMRRSRRRKRIAATGKPGLS